MNPNFPPQAQDQAFMEEVNAAAARINAEAAAGNVYGAPEQVDPLEAQVYTTPATEALGRVSGAAVVAGANSYVDPSTRGQLYAEYANHEYVAQQNAAEIQQRNMLDADDNEKVDA